MSTAEALHAQAVAETAAMRPAEGARLLREALTALQAQPGGSAALRGRILVSLAHAEAEQGNVELGIGLLGQAEPLLPAEQLGVLFGQRALLLMRTGRHDDALVQFSAAIGELGGEELARALLNRGVLHLNAANGAAARADLARCMHLATQHGLPRLRAKAQHNLSYLEYLAGDLPSALRGFTALSPQYAQIMPAALPVLAVDRARALLSAGLSGEAMRELGFAIGRFGQLRLTQDLAEAQLAYAEAALLEGRRQVALRMAKVGRAGFQRRGNARWAALASFVLLRARFSAAFDTARKAVRLSWTLDGLGLHEDARSARLLAAQGFAEAGRLALARRVLAGCGPLRAEDRIETRLRWRLAHAFMPGKGASRHVIAGLEELQRHRSLLGDPDLQTGSAALGRALAQRGLQRALASREPAGVYEWSERARAQAMLLAAVRPPQDPAAAAALEALRHARAALRNAELTGEPSAPWRERCGELQRAVREHAWAASGSGRSLAVAPLTAVQDCLGTRRMLVYVRVGARLLALLIGAGQTRLVPLGEVAQVEEAVKRLRSGLDAAAGRVLPARMASAIRAATHADAQRLCALVLDPLLPLAGDGPLVIVPTGALVTVPWAALQACRARPVTVAPSATAWLHANARAARAGAALCVAGPRNDRGQAEAETVGKLYPGATVLCGAEANAAKTLDVLGSASLAHIVAHGQHEPGNALFSALDLHDGPLLGYDLRAVVAPSLVVLSSCEVGLHDVRPGDESLGMATVLLAAGAKSVIASVSRVADEAAMPLMVGLHRELSAGRGAAEALATAGAAAGHPSFICFGGG